MPYSSESNAGLASHWPCVADFSGLSTYRLEAYGMEMSLHSSKGYGTLCLYLADRRILLAQFHSPHALGDGN